MFTFRITSLSILSAPRHDLFSDKVQPAVLKKRSLGTLAGDVVMRIKDTNWAGHPRPQKQAGTT